MYFLLLILRLAGLSRQQTPAAWIIHICCQQLLPRRIHPDNTPSQLRATFTLNHCEMKYTHSEGRAIVTSYSLHTAFEIFLFIPN